MTSRFIPAAIVLAVTGVYLYVSGHIWAPSTAQAASDHLMTALPFLAGALSFGVAARHRSKHRLAWLLLGGWGMLAAGGNVVWTYYDLVVHIAPFPSPADIGYLGGSVCAVSAVIAFMTTMPRASRVRTLLDGALIAGSVFILSWTLVLHQVYNASSGSVLLQVVGLSYPIIDIAFLTLIVFAASRAGSSVRTPLTLIGLGIFGWVISDSAFAYFTVLGTYQSGGIVDIGWLGGHALIGLAAFQALLRPAKHAESDEQETPRLRMWLPYFVAGVSIAIAAVTQIVQHRFEPLSIAVGVILLVVVLVRQFVMVIEHKSTTIERLRSVDEMKNQILRAVSHELRTPLTVIKGIAELLGMTSEDLSPEQCDLVVRLNSNADRLEDYLSSLLDLERLTRGVIEPARTRTELVELEERIATVVNNDSHTLRVGCGEVWGNVDPAQVERIVENLMINATRHTPKGTTIWASAERVPDGVLITVADDGPGIPDDKKDVIFEPFAQLGDTISGGRGSGIGLALVAEFARLHGGRAWVEDNDGGGARFRVLLVDGETEKSAVGHPRDDERLDLSLAS